MGRGNYKKTRVTYERKAHTQWGKKQREGEREREKYKSMIVKNIQKTKTTTVKINSSRENRWMDNRRARDFISIGGMCPIATNTVSVNCLAGGT